MKLVRLISAVPVVAAVAVAALAQPQGFPLVKERKASFSRELQPGSPVIIKNPNGTVIVTGTDESKVEVDAVIAIRGADEAAVKEGLSRVGLVTSGDASHRAVRTSGPISGTTTRWSATVSYHVTVPKTSNVSIDSVNSNLIQVDGVQGLIAVKNFNGRIDVTSSGSPVIVDTVNGNIKLRFDGPIANDARLTSLNGAIEIEVPRDASFRWRADTMKGDVLAPVGMSGTIGYGGGTRTFATAVGHQPSPTLITSTVAGTVRLIEAGKPVSLAKSVFPAAPKVEPTMAAANLNEYRKLLSEPPTASTYVLQRPVLQRDLQFETRLGNVFLGDVRGSINITTHAGEIVVARVIGRCTVQSYGGPLNLGEVWGDLTARTAAGDITIASVLKGGSATTGGGNILVDKVAGPLDLRTGGGDITVRHATASIRAIARSGDILVGIDPDARRASFDLRTIGGNVILAIPPSYGADVEATIVVTDERAHSIESKLPGLTIVRKQEGNRTSIEARGKINGGGHRVVLYAEEGNIQLRRR